MLGRKHDHASWAVIGLTQDNTGGGGDGNLTPAEAQKAKESSGFTTVYREDGIVLMHRSPTSKTAVADFCSSPYQTGRH